MGTMLRPVYYKEMDIRESGARGDFREDLEGSGRSRYCTYRDSDNDGHIDSLKPANELDAQEITDPAKIKKADRLYQRDQRQFRQYARRFTREIRQGNYSVNEYGQILLHIESNDDTFFETYIGYNWFSQSMYVSIRHAYSERVQEGEYTDKAPRLAYHNTIVHYRTDDLSMFPGLYKAALQVYEEIDQ